MIPLPHVPLQFILSMNAGRFPDYPIEYSKCSPKGQINTLPYSQFLVQKNFYIFQKSPFLENPPPHTTKNAILFLTRY